MGLAGKKQILWLEVAVDHTRPVAVSHTVQDLLDAVAGVLLAVVLPRYNVVKQLTPRNEVKQQVVDVGFFKDIVKSYNALVAQHSAHTHLLLQLSLLSLAHALDRKSVV